MQPTSLAVTPAAPRAVARDAPIAPVLTLAADARMLDSTTNWITARGETTLKRSLFVALITVLTLTGCTQGTDTETQAPLHDWSTTVGLQSTAGVIDSVLIYRSPDGRIGTKWFTHLAPGSKAMLSLGRWEPKPEEGIPHGPRLGQVSKSDIQVVDGLLTHAGGFSNRSEPHGAGDYFFELYVRSASGPWEQPAATADVLSEFGTVDEFGGHEVMALARFTLPAFPATR